MNCRGHELTGSTSDQQGSWFYTTTTTKELLPFTFMWRTSHLSLRVVSGTDKQTKNSSGAFFLLPFPFSVLGFLCSWGLSAEVPGTLRTMFSLISLALLSGSLTTKTKPKQTKQATEDYLEKPTGPLKETPHSINERPFRRTISCLHKQKWLIFHVVACFWASLLPPNFMLVKHRARRSQPLYSPHCTNQPIKTSTS